MKPGDFFLGVTDLFAVLLPGAVAAGVAYEIIIRINPPADHLLTQLVTLSGVAGWFAFTLAAYVLGHLIAALGAKLDRVYDDLKTRHRNEALHQHANRILQTFIHAVESFGKTEHAAPPAALRDEPPRETADPGGESLKLTAEPTETTTAEDEIKARAYLYYRRSIFARIVRRLAGGAWVTDRDLSRLSHETRALRKADQRALKQLRIKLDKSIDTAKADWAKAERNAKLEAEARRQLEDEAVKLSRPPLASNAYKLARIVLNRRAPTVFAEVARLEADSKFFRSFVVVAMFGLIACVAQLGKDAYMLATTCEWKPAVFGIVYLALAVFALRLAFGRFCDLRLKATETAFQGLLAMVADHALLQPVPTTPHARPAAVPVVGRSGTTGASGTAGAGSAAGASGTAGTTASGTAGATGSGTAGAIASGTAGATGSGTAGAIASGTAGAKGLPGAVATSTTAEEVSGTAPASAIGQRVDHPVDLSTEDKDKDKDKAEDADADADEDD